MVIISSRGVVDYLHENYVCKMLKQYNHRLSLKIKFEDEGMMSSDLCEF